MQIDDLSDDVFEEIENPVEAAEEEIVAIEPEDVEESHKFDFSLHREENKNVKEVSVEVVAREDIECSEEDEEQPEFSLFQSNVLYLCFFSGALICLALDVTVQINRKPRGTELVEFLLDTLYIVASSILQ